MTNIVIPDELLRRLEAIAERENRPPAEVLESMMADYSKKVGIPDEFKGIDPDVYYGFRRKLYGIARRYWEKVGDTEKLALSDEYLDEHLWLIDHEGIPRFNDEKGQIELPPDPLEDLVGLFADSNITDASTTVRERKAEILRKKYGSPD